MENPYHPVFLCFQLVVGTAVLCWSLSHCNQLRSSFKTEIQSCPVSDYYVTCAIPANGMNVIVFDLCNVTLVLIVLTAAFSLFWHVRFYSDIDGNKGTLVDKLLRSAQNVQITLTKTRKGGTMKATDLAVPIVCIFLL